MELTETATFGDGVTAELTSISAIEGQAQGIGEIAGPALRVALAITNGTPDPLSLDLAIVNLVYGRNRVPATLLYGDPATAPFSGMLAPDATVSGVYVFTVPPDQRDPILIEVNYEALSPIVVFEGAGPR